MPLAGEPRRQLKECAAQGQSDHRDCYGEYVGTIYSFIMAARFYSLYSILFNLILMRVFRRRATNKIYMTR